MISDAYFEQFSTPKYRNRNPLQRFLIRRFLATIESLVPEMRPRGRVLEIGVGEGFVSGHLSEVFPDVHFIGTDRNEEDLRLLQRHFPRIEVHRGDIEDSELPRDVDLVLCIEVLEHLPEPERALDQILALGPRYAIFSVPHEPWFMLSNFLRGKNLRRFGNDPEHEQLFGKRSFRALLTSRFDVLDLRTPYPWIAALTKPRD